MAKRLEDMTLAELWELFPIELVPHSGEWASWAQDEIRSLGFILSTFHPVISHIGSTAIDGIFAKPIIDILVEIDRDKDWEMVKNMLVDAGYICMAESDMQMSFNKGYTPKGYAEKVFHIHVHRAGDNDEIIFRDYLNAHHEMAIEYENLKLSLLLEYRNNRDAYTEAKSGFVSKILSLAK